MNMADIWIMRLGHRPERDKRVTTHVALSSRALGAKGIFVDAGDPILKENIRSTVERFGGDFQIQTGVSWQEALKDFKGKVVHLTMYGQRIDEALPRIPHDEDIMVIVGAEKVPAEIYRKADFNVSVGNQPHSEISALSIFLYLYTGGSHLYEDRDGQMTVIPNERGRPLSTKMTDIPSGKQCIEYLWDAGCKKRVVIHCATVRAVAEEIAKGIPQADRDVVIAGALLHDIGRSKDHSIMHAYIGSQIVHDLGLSKDLEDIVRKHTGAGLDQQDVVEMGLPPETTCLRPWRRRSLPMPTIW